MCIRQITGETATPTPVPESLTTAWAAACKSKSKTAKNQLFNTWLKAGGDWGMSRASTDKVMFAHLSFSNACGAIGAIYKDMVN